MVEFKMAINIKLSQNEWVKFFFVQMVGSNLGKCKWVWEAKLRFLNPRWPNSRWLPSSSSVRMNEFESNWISLMSESEWKWKCFWVNLREENKMSEFHNAEAESKMEEFNMAEFKMAAIIKFSENEWVKFFLCKWWGGKCEWIFFVQMVETNLGRYEWVWEDKLRFLKPGWPNSRWQSSRRLPKSSWVRMNEFESD